MRALYSSMLRAGSGLSFKGQAVAAPRLFKAQEFNFESLGIGGLDQQFDQIFRRAFASRVFPPSMVERLGIRHVKGVLLFGPPGTGERAFRADHRAFSKHGHEEDCRDDTMFM